MWGLKGQGVFGGGTAAGRLGDVCVGKYVNVKWKERDGQGRETKEGLVAQFRKKCMCPCSGGGLVQHT